MPIFAIADLHLSISTPEKKMDIFGPQWIEYQEKLKQNWERVVSADDLVLIAGDISWAMDLERAQIDLNWLEALPGTKVLIKGNHDYWWHSLSKVKKILPPSCHVIQNDAFEWKGIGIAGARLWESEEFSFAGCYPIQPERVAKSDEEKKTDQEIFERELLRLEMSLKALPSSAHQRIAMTHYPPVGPEESVTKASLLFEKYGISLVVFGHLHNVQRDTLDLGTRKGIRYFLTSLDYLDFCPIKIWDEKKSCE